ncbi:MAG: DUF4097 family beta strand repeat-containing protein [Thermoanaerobaculia bacterium]|nr:DUF4097 family beta strand repeat-containing protein [Thermoanaerobaculia bacterium]
MSKKTRLFESILMLLLAVAVGSATVEAKESVERTLSAPPDVQISIENLSGSVRVEGWERAEIRVEAVLGGDTEGLEVEADGGEVRIEVEIPDTSRRRGRWDLESDLKIWAPAGASLDIETVSASIEVTGIDGELDIESVSGSIEATGGSQRADLSTVSGNIDFTGRGAGVDAESVSGKVRLRGVAGYVDASTVSGRIDVEAGGVERADFESVSGSIEFRGLLAQGARLDASSHSGNVELMLPADTRANFEIETFAGDIHSDFGGEARRTSRYAPGRELYHSTGDAAEITVETFSGSVYLVKKK